VPRAISTPISELIAYLQGVASDMDRV